MPANLTIKYRNAEKAYRQASSLEEELECLEVMLKELPKHKGTDKMQADLKQKISRVRKEVTQTRQQGGARRGFRLPRQGAGRAVIIGGPNAGKSQLLASYTNARPEIASYPFTTREPLPGMMSWEDIHFQLVDTPPITADVLDPVVLSLIRGAELVLLVVNLGDDDGGEQLLDVWNKVQGTRSRLAQASSVDEHDVGVTYTKTLMVWNKLDLPEAPDRIAFFREYIDLQLESFQISALQGTGLEPLRNAIHESMNVVRVYTRSPRKKQADMDAPFTLSRGQTVLDLARMIHRDVAENFKSARVWGAKVHDGTPVRGDYVLQDKDIVELST